MIISPVTVSIPKIFSSVVSSKYSTFCASVLVKQTVGDNAMEAEGEDKQRAMGLLHGDEVETDSEEDFDESDIDNNSS